MSLVPLFLALSAPLSSTTQRPGSLLATVPQDASVLVHCQDFAALRSRAERNDWYRLLGSPHGEPFLAGFAYEFRRATHGELDGILGIADALEGEFVVFDTGDVAGFVARPSADRARLAELVRAWLPAGDPQKSQSLELSGGRVELRAWPEDLAGWAGRAGHFAAFVDHPDALALYSGDDSQAVIRAITDGFTGYGAGKEAPIVAAYRAAGGARSAGLELYVDFSAFAREAEHALKQVAEDLVPDPAAMLGLEGTWLHVVADIQPGTEVECRGQLHLPAGTPAAELADTFAPLPHTLTTSLPKGAWALWALNWDLSAFYERARAAYAKTGEDGLEVVDAGIAAAQAAADVDPIEDIVKQLAGDFVFYFVDPSEGAALGEGSDVELDMLGFHAGLVDGDAFLNAFEKLIGAGGMESVFSLEEIAGADAYLVESDNTFDGGLAFTPSTFSISPTRRVLTAALEALGGAPGANLADGSAMQAALEGNSGACFFSCVEMTPLRVYLLPEMGEDVGLPPLVEGGPARDPFDSLFVSTVRRTPDGFEFHTGTR